MNHVMAVGRPAVGDTDFALDSIAAIPYQAHISIARCGTAEELIGFLGEVYATRGPIHVLDLVDHGASGIQQLAGKALFCATDNVCDQLIGREVAEQIACFLSPMAHFRLLGCDVASPPSAGRRESGRHLLWHLALVLGERRTVFGALRTLRPDDYGIAGFNRAQEVTFLYSSLAAIDFAAPTTEKRDAHLAEVMRDELCDLLPTGA